jgi:hypothetical protein
MSTFLHDYSKSENWIVLGNDLTISDITQIHGLDDIPANLDGRMVLHLKLPSIPIKVGDLEVGEREFYLCYSPQHSFLFVVETETGKRLESNYRPQYGANDNYDTRTIVQRIAWVYGVNSPKAKDPVIAQHLKKYLPPQN